MQYLAVILGIFGLELRIKNYIEENKTESTEEKLCKGAFLIRKHHNKGAFLNAGEKKEGFGGSNFRCPDNFSYGIFCYDAGNGGEGNAQVGTYPLARRRVFQHL